MFQNLPTIWAITMKSLAMPKLRQVSESILAAMNLMNRRQFASHWTYLLWIHSNYNTHCLYHFENPAIVAIKSDIFTFIHVKSIKVTSGFNLRRIKKSARGHWHAKKSKTNLKTLVSPLLIRPQGSQGCQKMRQDPLNMQQEVWRAKIAPNLKNIQKCLRKQGFFDIFSSILMVFEVCVF